MLADDLGRLATRVADPEYDPRHAILDVAPELLSLRDRDDPLPPRLRVELQELSAEILSVQPTFPSRRTTSPLFDREGLGRLGYERAERLAQRLVALARAVAKTEASAR